MKPSAERRPGAEEPGNGISGLLDRWAHGDPDAVLTLGEVLSGLGRRAFGVLLFVAVLPAFIPIPIGGAVSGPLVMLIGAQLLVGLRRPWLPGFLSTRGPHRHALARFHQRFGPWIERLERLVRPRRQWMVSNRFAAATTGLLLLLLGLLLSLPIPLTNYLFGGLLLLYALALMERDGTLMLAAWAAGVAAIVVFGFLSGNLAAMAMETLQRWF